MDSIDNIVYDPKRSIAQNAKLNGLKGKEGIEKIRYVIRARGIDRRHDNQTLIVDAIRNYLKKYPNPTKLGASKKLPYGINTIRKYWDIAKNDAEIEQNPNKIRYREEQEQEQERKRIEFLDFLPIEYIIEYLIKRESSDSSVDLEKTIKAIKKGADAKQQLDAFIEKEHANTEYLKNNPLYYPVPTKADLLKSDKYKYDTEKYVCVGFRGTDDKWKDLALPLTNMCNQFSVRIGDITKCASSEDAYMLGAFSNNNAKHKDLQEQILATANGWASKRKVRKKNRPRSDWRDLKIDWMLYCVWQKIIQNDEFRNIILAIPRGAMIIEDNSLKKSPRDTYWGADNPSRGEFNSWADKYVKSLRLATKAATDRKKEELISNFCNYGTFTGTNEMGRILTYLKDCLHRGIEPEIDYALLNRKKIYILGNLLTFNV